MKKLLFVLFASLSLPLTAATIELKVNNADSINNQYQLALLKEALKRDPNNTYTVKPSKIELNQGQMINYLNSGNLDIMWSGTNKEYEKILLPIRIPLFKGLLGHRLFIIKQGNQDKFNSVNSLSDLKQFKVGQGRQWADTQVLQAAGLDVVTALKYNSLFYMLDGERFDMFPRGVHEPFAEVEARPKLDLMVEKNLLLVYPLAAYFFVAKDNQQLAQVIESGLLKMIDDGSFDEFFYNHPLVSKSLEQAHLDTRTVIRIDNPNIPEKTPLDNKKLWFTIGER
ncbi:transporter substrate-binding domain-containing protein [Catenovulum sp. 2E275]|uniref:transporter substrate-binding domain-containing protein n=1 Tax=Catenovulum sp. 2E275 TaxID=2980497 RepID=UPI0021D26C6A|nr:transporter substrate-binding domain-containing protein [Catenovulum sp. 2E275]MCU4677108.1 transporter substrate-binding domain-containing protein [Catenovulum sp. 2E275]